MTLEEYLKDLPLTAGINVWVKRQNGDGLIHVLVAIDVTMASDGVSYNSSFMSKCGNPEPGHSSVWDMAEPDEIPTCLICAI